MASPKQLHGRRHEAGDASGVCEALPPLARLSIAERIQLQDLLARPPGVRSAAPGAARAGRD